MTTQEKIKTLENADAESLLKFFLWHHENFNPVDFDRCETYDLAKAEVLKRLAKQ